VQQRLQKEHDEEERNLQQAAAQERRKSVALVDQMMEAERIERISEYEAMKAAKKKAEEEAAAKQT